MRLIILVVAAAAAVLAGYMVFNLSQAPAPAPAPIAQVAPVQVEAATAHVLVARRTLPVGTLISPEDLDWAPWPEENLGVNFIVQEDDPEALIEAAGWVVRTQIYENEPVIRPKVIAKGETGYMAALVSPGKRAYSVEISAESASSGFILPDDRVDVILSYALEFVGGPQGGGEQVVTTTVMENVRVLSIDQQIAVDPQTGQRAILGSTALLELEPTDAELIAHSERLGTLSLSLRSVSDALTSGDIVNSRRDILSGGGDAFSSEEDVVIIFRDGQPEPATLGGS